MPPRRRRQRPAESTWTLAADPPLCRAGNPAAALAACPRGEACACQIDLGLLTEDLTEAGQEDLVADWDVDVSPDAVSEVAEALARASEDLGNDVGERLTVWSERLAAIAANGSSLASVDEFQ